MRRRFERRFDLAIRREMGWHNDRKANWNRLVEHARKLVGLLHEPNARDEVNRALDAARLE